MPILGNRLHEGHFRQPDVSVYRKPVNTLRSILLHSKHKTPKEKKFGVIYEITWDKDPTHVYVYK